MQRAKLADMAKAVEEIFRKMLSRDDDRLEILNSFFLFFNPFIALRNSAVGSQRGFTEEA